MRILVFGASGMLGNAMFRVFGESPEHEVMATARSEGTRRFFSDELAERLLGEQRGPQVEAAVCLRTMASELHKAPC